LHPKTILPAIRHGIPVRIRNSRAPEDEGTRVAAESEVVPHTVKAIAHKTGVSIVSVTSTRMLGAYGFLRALFEVFERHRTVVDPVAIARALVDIPSADADEGAVADFIAAYLVERGWTVERQDLAPGRPNVLATTGAPARVVFSSHLDTVPPHVPAREDAEFLHGR